MKLRNKKTGEILDLGSLIIKNPNRINCESIINYDSLSELNEEWEDYKEQKDFYYIQPDGDIHIVQCEVSEWQLEKFMGIGNYFETREEAEKAVEKLKVWKRLKDNRFRFETFGYDRETVKNGRVNIMIRATFDEKYGDGSIKLSDLNLLFGGDE